MRKAKARKARNAGYGSARWLGDEWVAGIARGERASQAAAEELAREVMHYREARKGLIECARLSASILEETHGRRASSMLLTTVLRIATAEEVFGGEKTDGADKNTAAGGVEEAP